MNRIRGATDMLAERILSKVVMAGPATPCAVWVGAYSVGRTRQPYTVHRRLAIQIGGRGSAVRYVAPLLLQMFVSRRRRRIYEACHRGCPTGPAWHGTYSCVDFDHLRWGTRKQNEKDKRLS